MREFTIFDAETGEVLRHGGCVVGDMQLQSRSPNEIVAEGAYDDREFYFDAGAPTKRPALCRKLEREIVADGRDVVRVGNVPPGTKAIVAWEVYQIDDGSLAFSTAKPGRYEIEIAPPFPYQCQVLKVTAK